MSMSFKPRKDGVFKVVVDCSKDPGKTKQGPSESCDINGIVARYNKTGFLEHQRQNPGSFRDVSRMGDFHSMVGKVRLAQEAFDALPALVRNRFHNDPGEMIGFLSDTSNRDEAVKLGLLPKPKPKAVADPKDPPKAPVKEPDKDPPKDPPKKP